MSNYRQLRSDVIDIKYSEESFWNYLNSKFSFIVPNLCEYLEVDSEAKTSNGEPLVQVLELHRNPLGIDFSVQVYFEIDGDVRYISGKYMIAAINKKLIVKDFEGKVYVTLETRESGVDFWRQAFEEMCTDMISRLKDMSPKI